MYDLYMDQSSAFELFHSLGCSDIEFMIWAQLCFLVLQAPHSDYLELPRATSCHTFFMCSGEAITLQQ